MNAVNQAHGNPRNVVHVENLRITFGDQVVVDSVSFTVAAGERVAIVGESGAGKSLTAAALLGLVPREATVTATRLDVGGRSMADARPREWRALRGSRVGLISQDALNALDPLRRVEREIAEPMEIHGTTPRAGRPARVRELLEEVSVPNPDLRARQYPHELSGGLRQRVLIASALSTEPELLVADEPTTALDATVQRHILDLLRAVTGAERSLLFVSHDLAAVAALADRVLVMRDGVILEEGNVQDVLSAPEHPYTRELLAASRPGAPRVRSHAGAAAVLAADRVSKSYSGVHAVRDVSLQVQAGQTVAVVGESGAGKTTLIRMLLAAERPDSGTITLDGQAWSGVNERSRRSRRARIQYVSQNPHAAFDPRWSIGRTLREALEVGGAPREDVAERVAGLLTQVELDPALASRRMAELSGGQRQRAAIARALATDPGVLILDEPLSALDVSVQARIIALLERTQSERDLAIVLVSHDLRVVASLADDVLVMRDGEVVEAGETATVFAQPRHPFTRELLAAANGL